MRQVNARERELCSATLAAVSYTPADYGALLRPDWAASRGCEVLPTESAARLPAAQIPLIAAALSNRGYDECYAMLSEDLRPEEPPFVIGTTPAEFSALNARYGLFRFVIAPSDQAWAIACNEWFNLFGAPPELLREMLGGDLQSARREFEDYAHRMGGSLPRIAAMYQTHASEDA